MADVIDPGGLGEPDEETDHEPVTPNVIAGTAVALAGLRLGPEAALALGAFGYKFEQLAQKSWAELAPQARHRVAQMLAAAARKLGCGDERLDELIGRSEQTRLLTGLAMSAAERTAWPPQVVALGRLLADGLIADGDTIDMVQFALNAMAELGRLDVSLLELLVRHQPYRTSPSAWVAADLEPAALYQFEDPADWVVGHRTWREDAIGAVRPELRPMLLTVAGTLTRHGLAVQVDRTREALEQLGKDFERQINRQADEARRSQRVTMPTLQMSRFPGPQIERVWSPTPLGEQVHGYYLEAAEQQETDIEPDAEPCDD